MKKNYVKPKTVIKELDAKCIILQSSNKLPNEDNGDAGVKGKRLFDDLEDW